MGWNCAVSVRSAIQRTAALGLLALSTLGCQNKGDVSGKVTYKEKPVPYGTVLFVGTDGASVQAPIQGGAFHARGPGHFQRSGDPRECRPAQACARQVNHATA